MSSPQPVALSYTFSDGSGGQVILDASVSENHVASAQVTQHQVETGPDVTDHIRPMPQKLTIEGVISNTPISAVPAGTSGMRGVTAIPDTLYSVDRPAVGGGTRTLRWKALSFSDDFDRMRDCYGDLIGAALGIVSNAGGTAKLLAPAIFTITTSLRTYDSMAITNFAVPRSVEKGNALFFSIDFQEIRIVSTVTVAALPSQKIGKQRRANKPAQEEVSPAEAKRSTLKAIVKAAGF